MNGDNFHPLLVAEQLYNSVQKTTDFLLNGKNEIYLAKKDSQTESIKIAAIDFEQEILKLEKLYHVQIYTYIHTAILCDQSQCGLIYKFLFSPWPNFFKQLSFLPSYKTINLYMSGRCCCSVMNARTYINKKFTVCEWSGLCVQQQNTTRYFSHHKI